MKNKNKKNNFANIIVITLFTISLFALLYSINNFKIYYNEVNESNILLDNIKKQAIISDDDLFDVNIKDLKNKYPDLAGWIKVNGTKINYPFAYSSIKDYYLDKLIDGTSNITGWIYVDNNNNINELDQNTIILAHGLPKNTTLFGDLDSVLSEKWYKKITNHQISISFLEFNTLWQIFSVYSFDDKDQDYLNNNFNSENAFNNFIEKVIKRSKYNFNIQVNNDVKIITLKTCYVNGGAVVIHAKLIKYQSKSNITGE